YSPCPATRSFRPSSKPAGTLTSMSRSPTRRPIVPPRAAVRNGTCASTSIASAAGCGRDRLRPRPRPPPVDDPNRSSNPPPPAPAPPNIRRKISWAISRSICWAPAPAELEPARAAAGEPGTPGPGRDLGPVLVVHGFLLRVTQRVVSVLNLLEPGFGLLVPRVPVRVVLARQLAVRLRNLVGRR